MPTYTSLQQPSTSINTGHSDDQIIPCSKHQKEIIEFYCHDHDEILCSVCVTLEHQAASCKVDYISDISGNTIDSKHYQAVTKEIHTTLSQFQLIAEDIKKTIHRSNRSLDRAVADIITYWEDINKELDELTEKQADNVEHIKEQGNNKHLNEVETTCEDVTKSL
jgi:hypothetical protein